MIKLDRAVIVEGKYDKIKLSNIIDAPIITTDGFGIFKDKELQSLIRKLAETNGIIVMTDSDSAGFLIRNFIGSCVPADRITNVYIPDIFGKERRKTAPSKEGKLGVEGVEERVITEALDKAGITHAEADSPARPIKKIDLYELGFFGTEGCTEARGELLRRFSLPSRLSANALVTVLNFITDYETLVNVSAEIAGSQR